LASSIARRLNLDALPQKGVPRQLSIQSGIWAVGFGAFLAGSAVFFTRIVGLSAREVAFGIGLANVVGLVTSAPFGVLADKIGYRRSWGLSALVEALVLLAYPLVHGFAQYLTAVVIIGLARSLGSSGQSAYGLQVLPEDTRVRTFAFMRTTANIGIAAGSLISGAALATGTRSALIATPLISGAAMAANAIFVWYLPREGRQRHDSSSASRRVALTDVRFMALAVANGFLTLHGVLTAAIVPLWAVTGTRAPSVTTAVVYIVNTVLVILLQVRATKGAQSPGAAGRLLATAGLAFFAACIALLLSHDASKLLALALVVAATVFLTAAELWQSAASWTLLSRLARPGELGAYSGVWGSGAQLQSIVGPAAFIWMVAGGNGLGWLPIGCLLLLLGIASPALVRWVESNRGMARQAGPEPGEHSPGLILATRDQEDA
jgi:Major Facilitator Superfamily